MTVAVVENPLARPFNWQIPQGSSPGVPRGQVEFQGTGIEIGASTAEQTTILISCALGIGFSYRLVDASVTLAFASITNLNEFGNAALASLFAFTPEAPNQSLTQRFRMDAGRPFIDPAGAHNGAFGFTSDASALPAKLVYQGEKFPTTLLNAQSGTTLLTISCANNSDTIAAAGSLDYYVRFLTYDINDENRWAINTPQLVI